MNLIPEERAILLNALTKYRLTCDETNGDYTNRDELESKLATGEGELDHLDLFLLDVAFGNVFPNVYELVATGRLTERKDEE